MNHQKENQVRRLRRRLRVRKPLKGQVERPRLSVFRSHKHISAQIIDDVAGKTLCAASTTEAELKAAGYGGNADAATKIGKLLAERALAKGITKILFDRREYRYHGRVAALATAAREAGLQF